MDAPIPIGIEPRLLELPAWDLGNLKWVMEVRDDECQ